MVIIERYVLGGVQLRTGPRVVGILGQLQTVIDRVKLLNKNSRLRNLYSRRFLVLVLLLISANNYYLLVVAIIGSIMWILLGALLGNNLYSKIGAVRMLILSWRYELVLLVILVMIKSYVLSIVLFYVISCELGRTPVDLIEGESELVSRFNTEYARREFVGFFLREYLIVILLVGIILNQELYWYVIGLLVVVIVRGSYPRAKLNEVVVGLWYLVVVIFIWYIIL